MKYLEIINEMKIGAKELASVTPEVINKFQFGFEAEFVFDASDITKQYIDEIDINKAWNLNELSQWFEFSHTQEMKLERLYDNWRDEKASEYADEKHDPDDEDSDWQEFYDKKFNSFSEEDFIKEEGAEKIVESILYHGMPDSYDHGTGILSTNNSIDNEYEIINDSFDAFYQDLNYRVDYPVDVFNEYHQQPKDIHNYTLEPDTSIGTDVVKNRVGIEIVSPLFFDIEDLEDNIRIAFDAISRNGTTDDNCGFHISFSTKDEVKINLLKLALLVGDNYITRMFGRQNSGYCKAIKSSLLRTLYVHKKMNEESWDDYLKRIEEQISTTTHTAIDISSYFDNGRIEFRMIGGALYHKKIETIMELIKRFVYVLCVAASEQFEHKTYLKKFAEIYYLANKKSSDLTNGPMNLDRIGLPSVEHDVDRFINEHGHDGDSGKIMFSIHEAIKNVKTSLAKSGHLKNNVTGLPMVVYSQLRILQQRLTYLLNIMVVNNINLSTASYKEFRELLVSFGVNNEILNKDLDSFTKKVSAEQRSLMLRRLKL